MKTLVISGFGGSYEWGCQRMLELGIAWLKEHPTFDFNGYKGRPQKDLFEFDGTIKCCPKTELSERMDAAKK